jgi:peroxiredoxin
MCVAVLACLFGGCVRAEHVPDPKKAARSSQPDAKDSDAMVTPAVFNVGDPAPNFADLDGVDDKKHSLDEFKDAKAVAVVFTCNKCPVAVAYEDRLIAFQKDYADKGVQVVAINVNKAEADKMPAMKTRAQEKGFEFPYLYDPSQKVARDFGAEVTPHVFLLDGKCQLAYVGPVDDNPDESQAKKAYLRDATDAVLAGKEPCVASC